MNATSRGERIIARVRAIPAGFVSTYKDIEPGSPRLVGCVLAEHWRTAGTRGDASDVPWHRVVRSDGSAPIGARQLELLRQEGVPVRGYRVDLDRARLCPTGNRPTTLATEPAPPSTQPSTPRRRAPRLRGIRGRESATTFKHSRVLVSLTLAFE
jgi:alkylated DNA nucleotide flippase Atl1